MAPYFFKEPELSFSKFESGIGGKEKEKRFFFLIWKKITTVIRFTIIKVYAW